MKQHGIGPDANAQNRQGYYGKCGFLGRHPSCVSQIPADTLNPLSRFVAADFLFHLLDAAELDIGLPPGILGRQSVS